MSMPEHVAEEAPNRVLVLVNEYSTQANNPLSVARLNSLYRKFGNRVLEVATTGDMIADQELLASTIQDGDYIGVAGGDGTMNLAMHTLVDNRLTNPVFSLWWGNGNDFGHALLGRPQNELGDLIQQAEAVPIYPIEAQVTNEAQHVDELRLAASYAGIGFSAIVAEHLNTESHRKRPGYHKAPLRIAYEGLKILQCAQKSNTFTVRMGGEEGEDIDMVDWLFANGPRIAKFGRLPVQYEEPRIFTHTVHNPAFLNIASWLMQLSAGALPEDFIEKHDPPIEFELRSDDTPFFFDAETKRYDAGTQVKIQRHHIPFYALKL